MEEYTVIIPKEIKILGHDITIKRVEDLLNDDLNDRKTLGTFDGITNTIKLRINNVSKSVIDETFLHEILEAVNEYENLGLEHKTLHALSENLFAVLRRNKLNFSKK